MLINVTWKLREERLLTLWPGWTLAEVCSSSCVLKEWIRWLFVSFCTSYTSRSMPTTKKCPECFVSVNAKKSVCECGHSFAFKRKRNTCLGDKRKAHKLKIAKRETRAIETSREAKKRQVQDSASSASKRALESSAETLLRQEEDRTCTARKRASETQAETLHRLQKVKASVASKRASETQAETLLRQEENRMCTARKRASETQAEKLTRCEQQQARMAKRRSTAISVEKAISGFLSKTKCGPDLCVHVVIVSCTNKQLSPIIEVNIPKLVKVCYNKCFVMSTDM